MQHSLEYDQYINLLHVLIIAPALWIALTPNLLYKIRGVRPETYIAIIKALVVAMVVYHIYRFTSEFMKPKNMEVV
jgi:hypothetical protein